MSGPGHHVTQRYHLAQFAGDQPKGQVWVYSKTTGGMRSDVPENISVENNFYSIETPEGWDTRLDDWITGVEGNAKPVYDELLNERIPDYSQAKANFAVYLALTQARTRTQRRISTEMYGGVIQSTMHMLGSNDDWSKASIADLEREVGKSYSEVERQEFRKLILNPADHVTISVSKNMAFASWGLIDKLAPIFMKMEWSIVKPEQGFFITSDNPLLRQVMEGTTHPVYGDGGYLNKSVNVSFPLSPKKMLLLTYHKHQRSIWETPRQYVEAVNRARAAHAELELYSHIRHKTLAKMALKYKDSRPGIRISGGGPKNFAKVVSPRRFAP